MQAQRIILRALAVAALGTVCMAQAMPSQGQQQGMGQPGQQGMGQPGMGQPGQMNGRPAMMTSDAASNTQGDKMFMANAARGGIAEVELGNLAKQNGSSEAVKQFGERMVTDHSHANDELHRLAQQKGVTLPTEVSGKDKHVSKALQTKQGPDFDKAYIRDMVKDHKSDVADFRNEAANGQDPEVKAWAQKTLPTLEQHLAAAKEIAGQVGADTNAKSSSGAMSSRQ